MQVRARKLFVILGLFLVLIAGYFYFQSYFFTIEKFSAISKIDGIEFTIQDENYLNTISHELGFFDENGVFTHSGTDIYATTVRGLRFSLSEERQQWPLLVIGEGESQEWASTFTFSVDSKTGQGDLTIAVNRALDFSEEEYAALINRDSMLAMHIITNWDVYPQNFDEVSDFLNKVMNDVGNKSPTQLPLLVHDAQ